LFCILYKDDFLGEYQTFHDMETGWEEFLNASESSPTPDDTPPLFRKRFGVSTTDMRKKSDAKPATSSSGDGQTDPRVDFDPRLYRPLQVTVSFVMHDIQGTLMSVRGPPTSNLSRFSLQMFYNFY
jgi:hypothetical protein